jgi:hypothetical protein
MIEAEEIDDDTAKILALGMVNLVGMQGNVISRIEGAVGNVN